MGWWQTAEGAIIGDPVAEYVEQLAEMGLVFSERDDLPGEIKDRLAGLYVEGVGRPPTDDDLRALFSFCQ